MTATSAHTHAVRPRPARPPVLNRIAMAIGRPTCHFLLMLLYRIRVEGYQNIPLEGPVIIIANHQSYFDSILVGLLAKNRYFRAIARSGLFSSRLAAWILGLYGAIALDQSKGDIAAFRIAIDEINQGKALVIHPEGSRTPTGHTEQFQRGFHLVLKRTNAVVVPIVIEGAYDVWPIHRKYPRLSGRIAVRALPPISSDALRESDPKEVLLALRRMVEEERLKLRRELRIKSNNAFPIENDGDKGYWE